MRFALCAGTWTGVLVDDPRPPPSADQPGLGGHPPATVGGGPLDRLATGYQRIALAVRDGGCLLCDRPRRNAKPITWSTGLTAAETDVDQMVLLCWSHHRQVDLNRWRIVRNTDPSPGAPADHHHPSPRDQWHNKPAAA